MRSAPGLWADIGWSNTNLLSRKTEHRTDRQTDNPKRAVRGADIQDEKPRKRVTALSSSDASRYKFIDAAAEKLSVVYQPAAYHRATGPPCG